MNILGTLVVHRHKPHTDTNTHTHTHKHTHTNTHTVKNQRRWKPVSDSRVCLSSDWELLGPVQQVGHIFLLVPLSAISGALCPPWKPALSLTERGESSKVRGLCPFVSIGDRRGTKCSSKQGHNEPHRKDAPCSIHQRMNINPLLWLIYAFFNEK